MYYTYKEDMTFSLATYILFFLFKSIDSTLMNDLLLIN